MTNCYRVVCLWLPENMSDETVDILEKLEQPLISGPDERKSSCLLQNSNTFPKM